MQRLKLACVISALFIGSLTVIFFDGSVHAFTYWGCYYDGTNRCTGVSSAFDPFYVGYPSYAACDAACPF